VATVSLVIVAGTLVLYPIVGLWGPVPLRRFAVEIAPVQVVAASTQSSLATLPAMIECARDALAVPQRVAGLVLPLAVAVFRYTSPMGNLAVCFFIAALYGFEPSLLQMATAVLVALAVSVARWDCPARCRSFTQRRADLLALGPAGGVARDPDRGGDVCRRVPHDRQTSPATSPDDAGAAARPGCDLPIQPAAASPRK